MRKNISRPTVRKKVEEHNACKNKLTALRVKEKLRKFCSPHSSETHFEQVFRIPPVAATFFTDLKQRLVSSFDARSGVKNPQLVKSLAG